MNATTPCSGGVAWTNYPATKTLTPYHTCTPANLDDIVAIIREAEAANKHVHAFGSTWSFSDCALTTDCLVDTRLLNRPIQTVQEALLSGESHLVYHVEAGMTIKDIYTQLGLLGAALETQGGSSGQTIAGAISTGTHGGDLFLPPIADSVLALHMVGAGGTVYWIEPSHGITDPVLLQKFVVGIDPKSVIYNDALFNACLVGLGCMGVIYAVVLRVREAYDLIETTAQTTWQEFLQTAPALLRDRTNRFLQVAVSPYADSSGNHVCMVTTRSEAPATGPAKRPSGDVLGALFNMILSLNIPAMAAVVGSIFGSLNLSDDEKLVKMIQAVLSQDPSQQPALAQHYGSIMSAYLPPGTFRGLSYSVMDTTYGQSAQTSQPSYSAEVFFPSIDSNGQMPFAAFVNGVIAAISAATQTIFAGYVSLRFTGETRATLGMQQWAQTCSVELSCLQGVQGEFALYPQILNLAAQHGGLLHWGQINQPFRGNGTTYPGYAAWRSAYAIMSKNFTARTFENALSRRWDLTTPLPAQHGLGGSDYDGDGQTDYAVWRPSQGEWYVIHSSDGSQHSQQWGTAGDIPVPGDYDGDGQTDYAVWRPSEGNWYVIHSSDGSTHVQQWGTAGDVPVPGDYDGDGQTDFAVWRPSQGEWYVIHSSDGSRHSQQWGTAGDVPVPGDYDGDGKTDFAVWRPSSGDWLVIHSSDGSRHSQQWGTAGDIPAPSLRSLPVAWVNQAGDPLVRFTGSVHTWFSPVAAATADAGRAIQGLTLVISTGDDDLRGGTSPSDNCDVILQTRSGTPQTFPNINQGAHWNNGETHSVALPLPPGHTAGDITGLTLQTQFSGGIGGDNWNVNLVALIAQLWGTGGEVLNPPPEQVTWINQTGNPLVRFTGSVHTWSGTAQVAAADAGRAIRGLTVVISTGDDDLRGGTSPSDNCDVILQTRSGTPQTFPNINQGAHWNNGETHSVALPLPPGHTAGDITGLTLQTQFSGGIGGDNWNVNLVTLIAQLLRQL